jgi:hypothetical protein
MKILINFLVLFFILLLSYQIYLQIVGESIFEGLENEKSDCDLNDPQNIFNMARLNASDIIILKKRIDDLDYIQQEVNDLSANLVQANTKIDALQQGAAMLGQSVGGTEPITVTGT